VITLQILHPILLIKVNYRLSRMCSLWNKLSVASNRIRQVTLVSQVQYTGAQVVGYTTALFTLIGRLKLALDEIAESSLKLRHIQMVGAIHNSQLSSYLDEVRLEVASSFHDVGVVVQAVKSTPLELLSKGLFSM
jgi:hypothetical protein